ncbi:MAG: flagellar biosynthesis protein FlhF [Candidatus Omnitrophica bacterium]|nr:Signal recognition particle 54 kDa protein [bacterium]NUN95706.1 flagellar biosynthesis protein FlhF [Candidatus Omnitrophota bacterium]
MRIRKFAASTVQQAMARVKAEMGEDAVILNTRTFPGRFFGLLGKPWVEVTAALEDQQPHYAPPRSLGRPPRPVALGLSEPESRPVQPREPSLSLQAAQDFLSRIEELRLSDSGALPRAGLGPVPETTPKPRPTMEPNLQEGPAAGALESHGRVGAHPAPGAPESLRLEALEVRIDRLANTMERLLSLGGPLGRMGILTEVPVEWHSAMKRLMESTLSETLLAKVAHKLKSIPHPGCEMEPKILREILAGFVMTTPPIGKPESGQRVITLIGPTGVGKTTTLAKLASGLVVNPIPPTKVGLITVDTYRLAAEDQLRKYAEILRLDLHVVYGPEELPDALRKCHDADVVFIDTAGRSPRDESQMGELKSFLDRVPDCERYLVLSSTMNERYVQEAVDRFRPIGIHSLIVTKLDETLNFAAPLNMLHLTHIPVSYITTGQNVPEDIEPVNPTRLAEEVLARTHREDQAPGVGLGALEQVGA